HPPTQGANQPTADPGGGLSPAQPRVSGLIALFGMYWHLSACAQSFVRDVLALTPSVEGTGRFQRQGVRRRRDDGLRRRMPTGPRPAATRLADTRPPGDVVRTVPR